MSGLKKCHFDAAVDRLKDNMRRFAQLSREASARFANLGTKNNGGRLGNVLQGLDDVSFSDTVAKFAAAERQQLVEEIEKARSRVSSIEAQVRQADAAMQAAMNSRNETEQAIDDMEETLAKLKRRAQHKIETTDYMKLALDNEVHAVDRLSEELKSRIRETGGKLSAAHDRRVAAQGDLAALEKTVRSLLERKAHVEALAEKRHEAHKIREAQKKASVQSSEEIAVYVENIKKEDHERFMPKGFEKIQQAIRTFEAAFKKEDYKRCSEEGPKIVESLKAFFEELSSIIQAFHEAEQKTRSQLQAAQEELASLDLAEISRWSQKGDEVQQAVAQLEELEKQVDEISKTGSRAADFDVPQQRISATITALRALVDEATNNHARYDARDGIRKAIRDALKELKYDKPEYYFQKKLADGKPDELSGLTIYAHNPAETGNLRVTVDLDGNASLEVYREDEKGNELEVTQRDTVACHNAVLDFGRQLETAGIHMNITDWGKAKDLAEAPEQEWITWNDANPDRDDQMSASTTNPAPQVEPAQKEGKQKERKKQ